MFHYIFLFVLGNVFREAYYYFEGHILVFILAAIILFASFVLKNKFTQQMGK